MIIINGILKGDITLKIKIISISIFIVLTILLIFANLPIFNVTNISVQGVENISEEEVISIASAQNVKNIFWLSSNKIEKAVETLPYAKSVEVDKIYPNALNINVLERKPIAYLVYNKNNYIYIDNEGYVLEVANKPLEDKPFVTGVKFENFILGEQMQFKNAYTLTKIIAINTNMEKYKLEKYQITIDLLEEFNVKLIINDITVDIGEFENIDKKMRYLKSILVELDNEGYTSGYIDLKDFNKPITFKFSGK